MHVVVIFESIWGDTERLVRAIAVGIGDRTEVINAASAPAALDGDVDLLVVGGPTHAFSMSTEATRKSARDQGATQIPARATPVATFDTRVVSPRLPGSAAKKAMKRLVALGFQPIAKPETFGVHGYSGPFADGELERARQWGNELARLLPGD